jgi:hypothetical protein
VSPDRTSRALALACFTGLGALGLMVYSLFDPSPLPVVAAMSIGQVLGTASLGTFVYVVFADARARLRAANK